MNTEHHAPVAHRLILWDVDRTLLVGGGVGVEAYAAAFTAVTGHPWRAQLVAAGRTDRTLTPELFAAHGLALAPAGAAPVPGAVAIEDFFDRYAAEFTARAHRMPEVGTLLPGVTEVLSALAARDDVVQTLVTGNIRAIGVGKVTAFGVDRFLDLTGGGWGDDPHTVRADLVRLARQRAEEDRAAAGHGPFADADVLVVGDTVHDVTAAREAGVVAVAVATGPATEAELAGAGADHVLADLSDTAAVVRLLAG